MNGTKQTSLIELLLKIPEDARLIYEHTPTESQSIPVGPMCRQAASELAALERERDEFQRMAGANALAGLDVGRENSALRAEVERLRGLCLLALQRHPESDSPVGQPIRRALGIGQYGWLTPEQIAEASRAALQEPTP